jgi:two-component system sensor histidine kinase TctE
VVQRATRPVRALSLALASRGENELTPLPTEGAPRELLPLVEATNQHMQRLSQLLEHQKRFVRDTSHQLRTPLAVLKAQVQSAQRGDLPADVALADIEHTVDRATRMANQMLALAKVEQLREQAQGAVTPLETAVRGVALDLAPLLAQKDIDFDIETAHAPVHAHEWMLSELTRNLLHNAIKHTPEGGRISVRVGHDAGGMALLRVRNTGEPIGEGMRDRLFEPFAAMGGQQGAGLGLAICRSIVDALDGRIDLVHVDPGGPDQGVEARVWLPPAEPTLKPALP